MLTDLYLTKTLRGLSILLSVIIADIAVLPNNELTTQQIEFIETSKLNRCVETKFHSLVFAS
jgi:hypothetical protein